MEFTDQNRMPVEIAQEDELWQNDAYFKSQQARLPIDAERAALTYRVSTKGQVDKSDDIPMQKIKCRKFAQEHGWRVVIEKSEKGVSGSKVSAAKRDVIQELRNRALDAEFDILLVYMFDRLGRIESETPFLLEWFVQHGIQMWSTHEGQQKIESHGDKLMNYIRFWQASGESEKTAIRTRDRLRQIASSGHYTGGAVPYGYRLVDQGRTNKRGKPVMDLEINPTERPVVQEIFDKIVREGYTCHRLATILNERGLVTHGGARFQRNHIVRIVQHEGYTGYIITKGARSGYMPELQIIDDKTYAQAVEIIEKGRTQNKERLQLPHHVESDLLLAGNVYCACCGTRMSGFHHKDSYTRKRDGVTVYHNIPKYLCYAKSQHLRECTGQQLYKADIVDKIVEDAARDMFETFRGLPKDTTLENEKLARKKQMLEQEHALQMMISQKEKELDQYDAEIAKCLSGNSLFTQEDLSRTIQKVNHALNTAKADLAQLKKDRADPKTKTESYYEDFNGWVEEYDTASIKRRRMILNQLFERIEIGTGYRVSLHVNMSYGQFVPKEEKANEEIA